MKELKLLPDSRQELFPIFKKNILKPENWIKIIQSL